MLAVVSLASVLQCSLAEGLLAILELLDVNKMSSITLLILYTFFWCHFYAKMSTCRISTTGPKYNLTEPLAWLSPVLVIYYYRDLCIYSA